MDDVYRRGARGGTDDDLLKKFDSEHSGKKAIKKHPGPSSFYIVPRVRNKSRGTDGAFMVKHFAGEVTYKVHGFLEKNRDALHGDLLMCMQDSSKPFVAALFADPSASSKSSSSSSLRRKGKSSRRMTKMPDSIAFKFKRQLNLLNTELLKTEPHYIRCIKTNSIKAVHYFEPDICLRQLIFAGVLECVRIRREGFPFRKTFDEFWSMCKRQRMEQCLPEPIPEGTTPKRASELLLKTALPVDPKSDEKSLMWQLGKTRVFMRDGVYEALQWWQKSIVSRTMQRWWRGVIFFYRFHQYRHAIVVLQRGFRRLRLKKMYDKWNKHIENIQRCVRGLFARRRVTSLRRERLENLAATKVQALSRANRDRKLVTVLRQEKAKADADRRERARRAAELAEAELQSQSAAMLQRNFRGHSVRARIERKRRAVHAVGAMLLMNICLRKFRKRRHNIIRIQALVRGNIGRARFDENRWARSHMVKSMQGLFLKSKLESWTIEVHSAASEGDTELLGELLRLNRDVDGDACPSEYVTLGNMFRTLNANVADVRSLEGLEPLLSAAVANEDADPAPVSLLLHIFGATFDAISDKGSYWVCHAYDEVNPFEKAIMQGDRYLNIAKMLLESSVDATRLLSIVVDLGDDDDSNMPAEATILDMVVEDEISRSESVHAETIAWLMSDEIRAPSLRFGTKEVIEEAIATKYAEAKAFREAQQEAERRRLESAEEKRQADPLYQLMQKDHEIENKKEAEKLAKWRQEEREREEALEAAAAEKDRLATMEWERASNLTPRRKNSSLNRSSAMTLAGANYRTESGSPTNDNVRRHKSRAGLAEVDTTETRFSTNQLLSPMDVKEAAKAALRQSKRERKFSTVVGVKASDASSAVSPKMADIIEKEHSARMTYESSQTRAAAVAPLKRALGLAFLLSSSKTGDESSVGWFYLDAAGTEQGPFSGKQMASWAEGGYLASDLKVRRGSTTPERGTLEASFDTIENLFSAGPSGSLDRSATPFSTSAKEDIEDAIHALEELLELAKI